ncbi:unnamed protein product [Rotaria socialis]|uniref:Methyltransferase n=1 Tax=Rotaria socialis TaxID=392032 RepID=A0A817SL20_9BILA|nr:unnamed protein product [Rotaria socialis]CAF4498083.1 unnamed protein product [Rotaria socialis]
MSKDTTGELYFFSKTTDGSPPWIDGNPALGWTGSNFVRTPTRIKIHDLRGKENTVDLDTHGFEILKYDGNVHDEFDDNSESQRHCYDDIVAILKKHLGASRVIICNHIFRYRSTPRATERCDESHKNPVFYPHVDYDPPAARLKVEQVLGVEEANQLQEKHIQIVNVWRPIGPNPIMNTPLTICDYRSLDIKNDIHLAGARGSTSTVSVYIVSHNSQYAQRWHYLSQMRSDEMFVFKNYDSNSEGAQFGAHTAFIDEQLPTIDTEQKSIEMRCIVIYD